MEQTVWKEIYFVDSITDYTAMEFPGHVAVSYTHLTLPTNSLV